MPDEIIIMRLAPSFVPRPLRAMQVSGGGLETSAVARSQANSRDKHPSSPATTGNKAGLHHDAAS